MTVKHIIMSCCYFYNKIIFLQRFLHILQKSVNQYNNIIV